MIQKIQNKLNNRKGFTLIELIVVIVILGILAAILVPTFTGYANDAKKAADDATIANIKTVLAVALAEDKLTNGDTFVITAGKVTGEDTAKVNALVLNVMPEATKDAVLLKTTANANTTFTVSGTPLRIVITHP